MKAAVDISMYPLDADYETPILDFIARLNQHEGLSIQTNALSTQISGDYDLIMQVLTREIKTSFLEEGTQIMVLKILNIDIQLP
ncbi:MAG: thiamine-binding protein [Saprospiraceae bacterium]|nr:thiamine-binding protein [Saprospiraceae bacterium]